MAKKKKGSRSKKSQATVLHKEAQGIRRTLLPGAMRSLYRAMVAWLRHLAAVLRRAGAAVASNTAPRVGLGVPPTHGRVEASDIISAGDSGPYLTPSTGTPTPPTGTLTPPPSPVAKNSVSQACDSPSAPASKSHDSAYAPGAEASDFVPANGRKNSGSQASGSAPGPASGPCPAVKPAMLPTPTGVKTTPGTEAAEFAHNRGLNQNDPFPNGYDLSSLFEENECFVEDEDALLYARFCFARATALLNKNEICHICFFLYGKVSPFKKDTLEDHCQRTHPKCGFLCKKKGCIIRTCSLKEAGRHHLFCHEMHRDWWVECLKSHGEM